IEAAYMRLLSVAMRRRWAVVLLCGAALLATGPLFMKVPKNFLPDDDESQFEISVRAPEGASLRTTEGIANRVAEEVRGLRGTRYTLVTVAGDPAPTANLASIYVRLAEIHERKASQSDLMRQAREQVLPHVAGQGLRVSVQQVSAFSTGQSQAQIQYTLSGPDLNQLAAYAQSALAKLKSIPGVVDADSTLVLGKPELSATIDRPRAADLGVQPADVATSLRLLVGGQQVSTFEENGEQYEVWARALRSYRTD